MDSTSLNINVEITSFSKFIYIYIYYEYKYPHHHLPLDLCKLRISEWLRILNIYIKEMVLSNVSEMSRHEDSLFNNL